MSEVLDGAAGAPDREGRDTADLGAARWLGLAAAPTFALMAWLTATLGGGKLAMICTAGAEPAWLGGMAPMYLLMSALHSGPWLKLIAERRNRALSRPRG